MSRDDPLKARELGCEPTPEEYVSNMVAVFREVRRVLRPDGTLWLNIGDSYYGANWRGSEAIGTKQASNRGANASQHAMNPQEWRSMRHNNLKPKDLVGIPWRVAFALQADGWWLRSDIIWAKTNPMPESVKDRPTRSHEYLFLLTKSARYYYHAQAIAEPSVMKAQNRNTDGRGDKDNGYAAHRKAPGMTAPSSRNKRDVWTITTKPFKGAHFATMPPDLVEPCILAGSKPGDVVLDPFAGAGTVPMVAERHGQHGIGIELSMEYCQMADERIYQDAPLWNGAKQ